MKLAIIIKGAQNSGKTSTIRVILSKYAGVTPKQMKAGWKRLTLNLVFTPLKTDLYCIPASPSETNIPLDKRFANWMPDMILLAEQDHGIHTLSTSHFLLTHGYDVIIFHLSNLNGIGTWDRFTTTSTVKLNNRADEVIQAIKSYITTKGIL